MRRVGTRPTESAAPATISAPGGDPPIVARLVEPMLALRASLGTGAGVPDEAISAALANASEQAASTEFPHRDGLHAIESTWSGAASDAGVPAMRTTQTEIGDISDRGPAYLSVLADAQSTSARAAGRVDRIIEDFRGDARIILDNANSAPDTDAVIARATRALRDAIGTVTAARTEMDDHTRRLDEMGPLTVTSPKEVAAEDDDSGGSTRWSPPEQSWSPPGYGGTGQYGTGQYGTAPSGLMPGQSGQMAPGQYGMPGQVPGQPMDPALAAQMQLQQALIAAGVQVGTTAISAGVDIGTHLIDKIAEVGTHAMDTVAASADKAITEAINPGANNGTSEGGGGSNKLFDFGGGTGQSGQSGATPSVPSGTGPGASVIPPSPGAPGAPERAEVKPVPEPSTPSPAIPPSVAAPNDSSAAPAPAEPDHRVPPGAAGGLALPPPSGNDDDHKPRGDGQLGVTVPAMIGDETVPAAVIGDFGDDTI
ncbi:hypothetical protein [Nocardia sp. BMG51109]|uniref:hypothetical protein n=1 Tax=Nocardia sp. BMG51109 TaxID=1056816 RepID=UPI0004658084|nr:hypothetical protein [Nocardia sp. BMG51109]